MDGFIVCVNRERFALTNEKRIYFTCMRIVMLFGSEAWPVKVDNGIRLERNYASMDG